ncbi:hypothetical protein FE634_06415 [Nocardioides dongxiaopingii]|uniref:hypothetical protein n=1 Tax=Nocardioides sp. S-1144 TaxID=2582905 RepID=UPI00110E530C|nr:hypothetical protein [Nocardioides sp. S-1144]QCW50132.1 hypothetical protein FE634_06415 [Nocardioides sp. S-1144]
MAPWSRPDCVVRPVDDARARAVGVLVVGYRVPEWRVGGSAFSSSGTGGTGGGLGWLARSTRVGGTLEVRGVGRDPVGGLVVVPRWLR